MGQIRPHQKVKLFAALLFSPLIDLDEIFSSIEAGFDEIDSRSTVFSFDPFTSYYFPEMGKGLQKVFISFKELIDPDRLPDIKISSNNFEKTYQKSAKRLVNLDPGYLTLAKVVLATTKDYSHRIYLGQGIFGDLHLTYGNKSFQPQPWTYPDYKQDMILRYFENLRRLYREQLFLNLQNRTENT